MARRGSRTLTEVELAFMHVIWPRGDVGTETVRRALRQRGRDLADGSVRKFLSILVRKGYLSRKQAGRGFIYSVKVSEGKAKGRMLLDLLKRGFGGSPTRMFVALLESGVVRRRDLSTIKQLIAKR